MIITHRNIKGGFATFALTTSLFFFIFSSFFFSISEINRDFYYISDKEKETPKIDFIDPDIHVEWMNELDISQLDNDSLDIDQELGVRAYIETKEVPKEAVVHMYHEDMKDFFLSNEEYAFRQITLNEGGVIALEYLDAYSIYFDLTGDDVTQGTETFTLNGFDSFTFKKSGIYYAIVSMKLQDGSIVHYPSSTSVMEIRDAEEKEIQENLERILKKSADEKADAYLALSISVLGTGFGLFFVGINFWFEAAAKDEIKIKGKSKKRLPAMIVFPIMIIFGFYVVSISSGIILMILTIFLTFLGMIAIWIAFPKTSKNNGK